MLVQTSHGPQEGITHGPISPKGSPAERLWIIAEAPLSKDADRGYLFSSPMGWSFDKILGEVGINRYYITYCNGNNDDDRQKFIANINHYMPPIIISLDGASLHLLPKTIRSKAQIQKWAGSLLNSDLLSYEHYIIPTHGPETCIRDWTERQVVKYIDLAKAKDELDYWLKNKQLNPLPEKILETELDKDFPRLLDKLSKWRDPNGPPLSVDLEATYPKGKSQYFGHPGYPITCGIAPNRVYGISFELFRESTRETALLWRALGSLVEERDIIGQNFDNFDAWHFQMLGMPVNRRRILDTKLRHAQLWPELPHSLQFLTRQYTRQPYYKDEGHHWNPHHLTRLKRYNALDCVTTYDVYFGEEEEFDERPHLR